MPTDKNEAHSVLRNARKAVEAIDGPYDAMCKALKTLDEAYDVIVDDEVYSHCDMCGEPIWLADPRTSDPEGDVTFCAPCAETIPSEETAQ